jgi:hypothetical protein
VVGVVSVAKPFFLRGQAATSADGKLRFHGLQPLVICGAGGVVPICGKRCPAWSFWAVSRPFRESSEVVDEYGVVQGLMTPWTYWRAITGDYRPAPPGTGNRRD